MGGKVGFDVAFREAGGIRRREPVPYPLTHAHIRAMCEKRERILRIQYPDEKLSDEAEAQLAALSLDDPDECFLRFKLLCGLWHVWEHGYAASRQEHEEEAETARWMIMAREPVFITIGNNRRVAIRSLSRAAMTRIHQHDRTRVLLGEKLDMIEERIAETRERMRTGEMGLWRGWLRIRKLQDVAARIEREIERHFRGIIANSLSPTGRAMLPEEAPEWWDELGAEDEAKISRALMEVGPLRYQRARRPAKPAKKADKNREPFTIGGLLRFWEPKLRLPPMALEDQDLAQVLIALEEGAAAGAQDDEAMEMLQ